MKNEKCRMKNFNSREAGLPERLAERLAYGR
jgi:hypothetical protein